MEKNFKSLNDREVELSRERHGSNKLIRQRGKGLIGRFFDNLKDPIIRILMVALIIEVLFTLGRTNFIEIFGIILAILIATVVTTLSEYGSEQAFLKIEQASSGSKAIVIRGDNRLEISSDDIVVGDILCLYAGNSIEADAVLLSGEIDVDQSSLNGENIEAHKTSRAGGDDAWELDSADKLFRGSIVTRGEGIARVMRVGGDTYYGIVAGDVQTETRTSPLKLRLSKLAGQISRLGYIVAVLVALSYLFNVIVVDSGFRLPLIMATLCDMKLLIPTLIHAFTLMITVIVVAVPEGLPMMITVVLSANMKRMFKDNILVKKLVGIETAGSLNILFTDKTGTLTEGRLSVDRIITDEGIFTNTTLENNKIIEKIRLNSRYNTDCAPSGDSIVGGNATDRAIAMTFMSEDSDTHRVISKTPFSSERKYSSVRLNDGRELYKGAPEVLLPRCRAAYGVDGGIRVTDFSDIKDKLHEAEQRGERVICVAEGAEEDNLIFVGLIVLNDKIRKGVTGAVREAMDAGIQIVMLTGDNIDTARHIAAECGFFRAGKGDLAISSDELSRMTDDEVKGILPRLKVLARALPQDKTRLVRLSQELELVVGMTGDGVNDAPSLKLADVGFAMGSGTDIAKGACDIIILDNSFSAISKTILYGRTIFKSIRKFITFQLIMNLAACGITLLGQFIGIDNPITIIQMLWVNIIMDTLGGLAFAGEAPMPYYMKERPKRRDEPIMSGRVLKHIISNGALTLLLLVIFLVHPIFDYIYLTREARLTAFYALFIFAGIFNSFSARSERLFIYSNISKNKPFIFIMLLISVIQIFIIYFGGSLFRSTPLTPIQLMTAIILASTVLVFDVIRRIFEKLK